VDLFKRVPSLPQSSPRGAEMFLFEDEPNRMGTNLSNAVCSMEPHRSPKAAEEQSQILFALDANLVWDFRNLGHDADRVSSTNPIGVYLVGDRFVPRLHRDFSGLFQPLPKRLRIPRRSHGQLLACADLLVGRCN